MTPVERAMAELRAACEEALGGSVEAIERVDRAADRLSDAYETLGDEEGVPVPFPEGLWTIETALRHVVTARDWLRDGEPSYADDEVAIAERILRRLSEAGEPPGEGLKPPEPPEEFERLHQETIAPLAAFEGRMHHHIACPIPECDYNPDTWNDVEWEPDR